jgi:hypothetical protein
MRRSRHWRVSAESSISAVLSQEPYRPDGATDLAVTSQGDVFVTELFGGRVSKVSAGGPVELVAQLDQPVAIEYFRGTLYVARGVFGPGQVVTLVP